MVCTHSPKGTCRKYPTGLPDKARLTDAPDILRHTPGQHASSGEFLQEYLE